MKIDLIVPALNEEDGIGETLLSFPKAELEAAGHTVRYLVVDGGSEDRTATVAREAGAEVIVEERPGYGRAYMTGFTESDADVIVTLDGDTTYSVEKVPDLIGMLDTYDFISTDRLDRMEPGAMARLNRLGNLVLSAVCRLLFRVPFHDSQSGMWVFRREILDDLKLTAEGMPFSEEIKIEAYRKGFAVHEEPIVYHRREGEEELRPWSDGLENLLFLFRKRLGLV